tara:strand:+ start:1183 stop:2052 length:870 start_codon:yes stop_codon:yes gene_type:complete
MSLITLNNNELFLELSPDMGASITKFRDIKSGKDIFRPFSFSKKLIKKNCYFSGYFATVPYFGAIHKKSFLYKDQFISLPKTHPLEPDTIHGEGWVSKWKIKSKSKKSTALVFNHNGKKGFPFKYRVNQEFILKNKSLCINISITNIDKESFYCGIGFHPWFHIDKKSKIYSNNFTYIKNYPKNIYKKQVLTKNKFLDLNKVKIDETFINWGGKAKLVINKDIAIEIKNKKNIKNLHVYSPPKENFFCIEPVTNIRDAYNIKKYSDMYQGLKMLKQNKTFDAKVEFRLI